MSKKMLVFVIFLSLLLTSACGANAEPPQVSEINASGITQPSQSVQVNPGDKLNFSITASGQDLTYQWGATAGEFSDPARPSVIYTAPTTPGDVGLWVDVKSGDVVVTRNVTVRVIAPTAQPTDTAIPTPSPEPPTATPTQPSAPPEPVVLQPYPVFVDFLTEGLDIGVASSTGYTKWIKVQGGDLCMHYPSGLSWGSVFIFVRPPANSVDLRAYTTLSLELKGQGGDEYIMIAMKDKMDPNDGSEKKTLIRELGKEWQTYTIALDKFTNTDLSIASVIPVFVFEGIPQTVCVRNIQFLP